MDPLDAADRLDLLFIAAATEFCHHVPDASCADCAFSIVVRGWEAVGALRADDRPAVVPTRTMPHGASLSL